MTSIHALADSARSRKVARRPTRVNAVAVQWFNAASYPATIDALMQTLR